VGDPVLQTDRAHGPTKTRPPAPAVDVERQRIRHLDVHGVGTRSGAGPPGNGTFAMLANPHTTSIRRTIGGRRQARVARPSRIRFRVLHPPASAGSGPGPVFADTASGAGAGDAVLGVPRRRSGLFSS